MKKRIRRRRKEKLMKLKGKIIGIGIMEGIEQEMMQEGVIVKKGMMEGIEMVFYFIKKMKILEDEIGWGQREGIVEEIEEKGEVGIFEEKMEEIIMEIKSLIKEEKGEYI